MSERPPLQVVIRPGNHGDMGFVYNSWLKSMKGHECWAPAPAEHFYRAQHLIIDSILQRPDTVLAVAVPQVPTVDASDIAGYIVAEPSVRLLHWIYVKGKGDGGYRRAGVGTELMRHMFADVGDVACSHWSPAAASRAAHWRLVYEPSRLRNGASR